MLEWGWKLPGTDWEYQDKFFKEIIETKIPLPNKHKMKMLKRYNMYRTDNLKLEKVICSSGFIYYNLYNEKSFGFCYAFSIEYETFQQAKRYISCMLKNISLNKKLNHK